MTQALDNHLVIGHTIKNRIGVRAEREAPYTREVGRLARVRVLRQQTEQGLNSLANMVCALGRLRLDVVKRFLLPIARETAGAACIRHSLLPLFEENEGDNSGSRCRGIAQPYPSRGRAVNHWLGRPLGFPVKTVSIRNNY